MNAVCTPSIPVAPAPATPKTQAKLGTVLVLGARGRLGYGCVQAFAQAGWRVLAHVRPGSALARSAPPLSGQVGVHWLDTDLRDARAWQTLLQTQGPVDVVVNTMASGGSSAARPQELITVAQQGIALARQAQALLLAPLTVLTYGRDMPPVLYEGTVVPQANPSSLIRLGQARREADQLLEQAADTGLQVCTLRSGTYYGYAGKDWISTTVASQLPRGRMILMGAPDVFMPWTYLPDLAQCIELLARQRQRLGGMTALHFAGQQRDSQLWQQALERTARAQGWLAPGSALQVQRQQWLWWQVRGGFLPHRRRLAELAYLWRTPFQLDNRQLLALIGKEPQTPWQQSVDAAVQRLFTR